MAAEVTGEQDGRPAFHRHARRGRTQNVTRAAKLHLEPTRHAERYLPAMGRKPAVAFLHIARGVQGFGVFVFGVTASFGELGLLLHQLGGIGKENAE